MFMATGGLPYYYSLWGPGISYAMQMNNINDDSTGRNYYKTLTGKQYNYNIGKQDLAFGQQVYYHKDKAQMGDNWDTPGTEGIWVGRSSEVSGGHNMKVPKRDATIRPPHLGDLDFEKNQLFYLRTDLPHS